MGNISHQFTQGVQVRINSQTGPSVESYQSHRVKSRPDTQLHNNPEIINPTPFPNVPDRHQFRHISPLQPGCPPVGLFPRDPQFPGLDSLHGRQSFYKDARSCGDAARLLELARYEADNQLMPDVKAGDILREAYQAAQKCPDAMPLIGMARLENDKQLLPDIKAGDLLREGYQKALSSKDAYAILEATRLENEKQLMPDIKAGDMLREAYHTALKTKDVRTLMDIGQYEQQHQLMKDIPAGDIFKEAQHIFP